MNTTTGLGIMPAFKIRVSVQVQPQVLNRTSFFAVIFIRDLPLFYLSSEIFLCTGND